MGIWLGLVMFVVTTGCSGLVDDGASGGLNAAEINARRLWLNGALPVLRANCISCHAEGVGGSVPAPTYLAGSADFDIRDTILQFEPSPVNLDAPTTSQLIKRGLHDGPALTVDGLSAILEWVSAEKAAGTTTGEPVPVIEVAQFVPSICTAGLPDEAAAPNPSCLYNQIALDSVGGTGARVDFIIQAIGGGMAMSNMKVIPGAAGVYLEHPTFVSYPAVVPDPPRSNCLLNSAGATFCLDPLDRFASTIMNVATTALPAEQTIGSGTTTFTDFLATDMMTIQFKLVGAFQP